MQSAQSFTLTVVLITTSTPMIPSYTLSPANFSHSKQNLKNCLNNIQNFMFTNKLKLNPDKTEFILIGSKNNRKQLLPHILINNLGNQVSPAQSVKNFGVVFDSSFDSLSHYAPVLWKSFAFHIRNSPNVTSFRKHLKTHLFNCSFPTSSPSLLVTPTTQDH